MAEIGQTAAPSVYDLSLYCIPCDGDDLKEPAYGYCQDCEEHLCDTCFKTHRKAKPSLNHALLDKDAMPKQQTSSSNRSSEKPYFFCQKHSNKPIEFFCNNHGSTLCYVCMALQHKQCKVNFIPDISENVSDEFNDLVERMEKLIEQCKSNVTIADSALVNYTQTYEKVRKDIKHFRKEINKCLDMMQSKIKRECKARLRTAKCKQEKIKAESLHIVEEMSCTLSLLNSLREKRKNNTLFVEMKTVQPRCDRLAEKERQTIKENETDYEVTFIRNEQILDQLKHDNCLGIISSKEIPSDEKAICIKHERLINMKFSSDKEVCDISGIGLLSARHMVVADCSNKKVKLIDVNKETPLSEIMLPSPPQDVTKLPNNKIAVAFWNDKCIQVISCTDTSLSLDSKIDIGEKCYCVAYCQGRLVVGCNLDPGKLVIVDLEGNFIQVIDTPGLLDGPEKIIISNSEKFIYVSDCSHYSYKREISTCKKMDWQGNMREIFQSGYKSPACIQELKDGTLLVCCRNNTSIFRLSSSLKKCLTVEVVGLKRESLQNVKAIAYSESDNKLYVSCSSVNNLYNTSDSVKIFDIKWL